MGKSSRAKARRRHLQIPPGASTDQTRIAEAFNDVNTEVAVLLADDPAFGGTDLTAAPGITLDSDAGDPPMPVALFEPRMTIGMTLPDGSMQEMQAEAIIQAGFTRWRQITMFEHLSEWTVRQTNDGLELWDHGGIWARGSVSLTPEWWDAANRWGVVLAVYGNQLGVTNYKTGDWTPQDRYNALR